MGEFKTKENLTILESKQVHLVDIFSYYIFCIRKLKFKIF